MNGHQVERMIFRVDYQRERIAVFIDKFLHLLSLPIIHRDGKKDEVPLFEILA